MQHKVTDSAIRPKENTVSVRGISVTSLLQHRAHQQFSSVKAGHGPIAIGQNAPSRSNRANVDGSRSSNQPSIRVKAAAASDASGIPVATSSPRTLRAKVSLADLRAVGAKPSSTHESISSANSRAMGTVGHSYQSQNPISRGSKPQTLHSKKELIKTSAVMSAMLHSRAPQKTIKAEPEGPPRRSVAIISGPGIKVKGSLQPAKADRTNWRGPEPSSTSNLRSKSSSVTFPIKTGSMTNAAQTRW